MTFKEKWRNYARDPFGFMDHLDLRVRGVQFNFFRRSHQVARNMILFSLVMAALWALCGFDSSPGQLLHVLYDGLPGLVLGQKTLGELATIYWQGYGKEMHYSAFVIYGLLFAGLSVHFDQGISYGIRWWAYDHLGLWDQDLPTRPTGLGIRGSKNIVYAVCVTLLAGGLFEVFWQLSFANFQGQPWVVTFQGGQARILLQDMIFVFVGILGLFYMWADSYVLDGGGGILARKWRFNLGRRSWILIGLTVGSVLLWWFYPWPTQQISVLLNNGQVWTSSRFFPQTLYTIALDPGSGFGTWFWVQNDAVHGLNVLVKVLMTLALGSVCMLKKVENYVDK